MWVVEHKDGRQSQHAEKPGEGGDEPGVRFVRIKRELDFAVERYDFDKRRAVSLPDALRQRIDDEHRAKHGPAAIDLAHAIKVLEARVILAGVPIDGLVAAEAKATGQDVGDLAEAIVANAIEAEAAEVARIVAKRKVPDGR